MANELQAATDRRTGLNCYFILTGPTGLVWDGAAFAAYSTANRNAGAVSATGRADGSYVATVPAAAGTDFSYALFSRAGGSPAETDELLAGPGPYAGGASHAQLVKVLAAVYDTATASGDVITLSNGATQTVTSSGRTTA